MHYDTADKTHSSDNQDISAKHDIIIASILDAISAKSKIFDS